MLQKEEEEGERPEETHIPLSPVILYLLLPQDSASKKTITRCGPFNENYKLKKKTTKKPPQFL
jgi:hypothetical protein